MAEISVKTFAETDLEDFLKLSKLEYGPSPSSHPEHIRWKHLNSPFGASSYIYLDENGHVVGRTLIQPRPLCTASKVFKTATVLDLLIDRAHRHTPRNVIQITKASSDRTPFDVIYHTSNQRTFPLYTKLFRFPNPFSLRAFGFPLRFAGLFASIIGPRMDLLDWFTAPWRWLLNGLASVIISATGLHLSQHPMSDHELEALSAKCLHHSGPHFARTNAFLKWRFLDAPLWPATISRIDRKGQFLGYVVTRHVELGGLNHLVLMDFLVDPDAPRTAHIALRFCLLRLAISSRADVFFTMANPFSTAALPCIGFPLVSIPDRLLPHQTPLFVRACNPETKPLEADGSIHLTLGDLDYF